jgi:hypothetical protein
VTRHRLDQTSSADPNTAYESFAFPGQPPVPGGIDIQDVDRRAERVVTAYDC